MSKETKLLPKELVRCPDCDSEMQRKNLGRHQSRYCPRHTSVDSRHTAMEDLRCRATLMSEVHPSRSQSPSQETRLPGQQPEPEPAAPVIISLTVDQLDQEYLPEATSTTLREAAEDLLEQHHQFTEKELVAYLEKAYPEIPSYSRKALVVGAATGAQLAAKLQVVFDRNKCSADKEKRDIAANSGSALSFWLMGLRRQKRQPVDNVGLLEQTATCVQLTEVNSGPSQSLMPHCLPNPVVMPVSLAMSNSDFDNFVADLVASEDPSAGSQRSTSIPVHAAVQYPIAPGIAVDEADVDSYNPQPPTVPRDETANFQQMEMDSLDHGSVDTDVVDMPIVSMPFTQMMISDLGKSQEDRAAINNKAVKERSTEDCTSASSIQEGCEENLAGRHTEQEESRQDSVTEATMKKKPIDSGVAGNSAKGRAVKDPAWQCTKQGESCSEAVTKNKVGRETTKQATKGSTTKGKIEITKATKTENSGRNTDASKSSANNVTHHKPEEAGRSKSMEEDPEKTATDEEGMENKTRREISAIRSTSNGSSGSRSEDDTLVIDLNAPNDLDDNETCSTAPSIRSVVQTSRDHKSPHRSECSDRRRRSRSPYRHTGNNSRSRDFRRPFRPQNSRSRSPTLVSQRRFSPPPRVWR